MSFISSYHDRFRDKIVVWEKKDSKRIKREFDPPYNFYVPCKDGDFTSVTNEKLKFLEFQSKKEFNEACLSHPKRFESDIQPQEKIMMSYFGKEQPKLNVGFIDIEVDYDPAIGFARPGNAYGPINALTIYISDLESYFTLLLPPPNWPVGLQLPKEMQDDNYIMFDSERTLLEFFIDLIQDCDILSGWNSEFFDLPYIASRIELLFGQQALRRLAFEGGPAPRWGEKERFKNAKQKDIVIDLISRVHLDYMDLFKKFNLEGRQSYSLGAITSDELDEPKHHYEGTLYELYRGSHHPNLKSLPPKEGCPERVISGKIAESDTYDIAVWVLGESKIEALPKWDELYETLVAREIVLDKLKNDPDDPVKETLEALERSCTYLSFIKFARYNRHDVKCIVELNKKFKYIDLANAMVHEATVNFSAIFGSVQLIDTAIINFCHSRMNKIVFDRDAKQGKKVEGAIVMSPKIGYHRMIGSCDINSLYPSTYRSLNLSPEKIIGQLAEYEEGWRAVYDARRDPTNQELLDRELTIIPEGAAPPGTLDSEGNEVESGFVITVGNMIRFLEDNKYALSAYGTILDQGNGEGLIPAVLTYWFKGRKELQAKKKEFAKKAAQRLSEVNGNKEDPEYLEFKKQSEYYDMLQGVRKVLLNSTYGATLNAFCRFHDPRLGASTTGSGRQITTHMIETVAKCLIGEDAPKVVKTIGYDEKTGEAINVYTIDVPPKIGPIYSDTDSVASNSKVTVFGATMEVKDAFNILAQDYGITDTKGKQMVWVNPNHVSALSLSGHLPLKGIYRHRSTKRRFRITLDSGKFVDVTEDHSVMVERNGKLIEVKPMEINRDTDVCISIENDYLGKELVTNRERISSVEELDPFNDEYVYDLVMEDSTEPYFFANGILVHNSCYFVMEQLVGNDIELGIALADEIVSTVNNSFKGFMQLAFNCQPEHDDLIRAAREVVAVSGIFRAKKKYMLLVADNEGTRYNDLDDPKALKTMGSDIKISSTPETIRELLRSSTVAILKGDKKSDIDRKIIEFRKNMGKDDINPLDYASIMSVNKLEDYSEKYDRIEAAGFGKVNLPMNVRSTINHNNCLKMFNDNDTQPITSGSKIKIVWLRPNEYNYSSMAFSSDTEVFPDWFYKNFEIDSKLTEQKLVDQKLKNIFDPIGWEVPTFHTETVNRLLSFD